MDWRIIYYSDDLQRDILAFPAGLQARYVHLTERMVAFGPDLGMPHTRAMGKSLFELRFKSKGRDWPSVLLHPAGTADPDAARLREEVCQDARQGIEDCPPTNDRGTRE